MTGPAPADADAILAQARQLAAQGDHDAAQALHLEILRRNPRHKEAMHALGHLAHSTGRRSAARTLYAQIVDNWPGDGAGRINLANILYEDGDPAGARTHFETALEIDPQSRNAHRGLGRVLQSLGDHTAAHRHWRLSFPGQASVPQPYRGKGDGVPLLLLVSAKGGNIPTGPIVNDSVFAATALYVEYYRPDLPLPPHSLVFNAVGDADLCADALAIAQMIVTRTRMPVINAPARVLGTGRFDNATHLAGISGLRVPRVLSLRRADIAGARALGFPLLLRAPGFHTGQHFVQVAGANDLQSAAAGLPGEILLAIEYVDTRGVDSMRRKYRVMCIDGVLYPLHLAISADWKVHYFTADMAHAAHRAEEKRFLDDMTAKVGPAGLAALQQVGIALGLEYCGIDFTVNEDGTILLFEANATMVINPPDADPIWDYRRAPIALAAQAAKDMLIAKALQR